MMSLVRLIVTTLSLASYLHWSDAYRCTPLHGGEIQEFALMRLSREELREQFINASPGRPKGGIATKLFSEMSVAQMRMECFDLDDSVAICASWQRAQRQLQARAIGLQRGTLEFRYPRSISNEFVGFIEGRLGVPVPDGWSTNVFTATYDEEERSHFSLNASPYESEAAFTFTERKSYPRTYVIIGQEADASTGAVAIEPYIGISGDGAFAGKDAVVPISSELVRILKEETEVDGEYRVTGIATSSRALIALNGDHPRNRTLICLATTRANQGKPNVYWQKTMDGYWGNEFEGGKWFTEFRIHGDRAYLFHSTHDSIGIECFTIEDGTRLFSFNSLLPK